MLAYNFVEPVLYRHFVLNAVRNTDSVWPVTIIPARYGGAYEYGRWIAIPAEFDTIPESVHGDDIECSSWFSDYGLTEPIGYGDTPDEALADLRAIAKQYADGGKLIEHRLEQFKDRAWVRRLLKDVASYSNQTIQTWPLEDRE